LSFVTSKFFLSKIVTYDVIASFLAGYAMLVHAHWAGNVAVIWRDIAVIGAVVVATYRVLDEGAVVNAWQTVFGTWYCNSYQLPGKGPTCLGSFNLIPILVWMHYYYY